MGLDIGVVSIKYSPRPGGDVYEAIESIITSFLGCYGASGDGNWY